MTTALTVLLWLLAASAAIGLLVTLFFLIAFIYAAVTQ